MPFVISITLSHPFTGKLVSAISDLRLLKRRNSSRMLDKRNRCVVTLHEVANGAAGHTIGKSISIAGYDLVNSVYLVVCAAINAWLANKRLILLERDGEPMPPLLCGVCVNSIDSCGAALLALVASPAMVTKAQSTARFAATALPAVLANACSPAGLALGVAFAVQAQHIAVFVSFYRW